MSKQIIKSGFIVLIGTMLYKMGFLVKDILLTSKLGVGEELTLFVTSFLIPSFLCNTLAQSLQVSTSNQIVKNQNMLSLSYLQKVFLKTVVIGLVGFLILHLLMPFIFSSFKVEELNSLRLISVLSFPFFIFMPVRGVLGQILYLRQHHLLNFSLALVSPFALIIYLLISQAPSAINLMIVLSVGSMAELLCVFIVAKSLNGIKPNTEVENEHIAIKDILNGLALQLLLMLPPLTDQLFAHLSDTRFLTVFNYANKIPNIITTVCMIIAASVLLPFFIENKDVSFKQKPSNKKLVLLGFGLAAFYVLIPYVSPLIVKLIYERGKFTMEDSFQVSSIQTYYFWSVPITAVFIVYIRYLNANNKHSRAVWLALSVSFFSILSGFFWVKSGNFSYIPFSVVISYIVTAILFTLFGRS